MSSPGWPSLEIERSARSQVAVVASVLIAVTAVPGIYSLLFASLSPSAAAATALSAACFASLSFWRIGWLGGRRAVHSARWVDESEWRIRGQTGVEWPATLSSATRVMGSVLWLRFDTPDGQRHLLFVGSDLAPEPRRRLVARLRVCGGYQSPPAAEPER